MAFMVSMCFSIFPMFVGQSTHAGRRPIFLFLGRAGKMAKQTVMFTRQLPASAG